MPTITQPAAAPNPYGSDATTPPARATQLQPVGSADPVTATPAATNNNANNNPTGSGVSVYTSGSQGLNGLLTVPPGTFEGAQVYLQVDQYTTSTQNIVNDSTTFNLPGGNVGELQYSLGNAFGGVTGIDLSGSAVQSITAAGNVSADYFLGNGALLTGITVTTTYNDSNVETLLGSGVNTNIIPAANGVYSLGNSTNYWSNLWVTSNTIFIGGVPLGVANGTLTVAGEPVFSNDSAESISTTGTVTATAFVGDGSQLTGITVDYGNANVANYLPTYSGDVSATNVTALGNVSAAYLIGDGSQITGLAANYGNADVANYLPTFTGDIGATNITAGGNVTAAAFVGDGSQLTGMYGNANVADYLPTYTGNLRGSQLRISQGASNVWSFNESFMSVPSGGSWRSDDTSLDDYITSAANGYINIQSLYASGNMASELQLEHGDVRISVDNGTLSEWIFDNAGVFTAAGNITTPGNVSAAYFIGDGSQLTNIAGATTGNLLITGTTIGIANGAPETTVVVGGNSSGLLIDPDANNPIAKMYAIVTDSDFFSQSGGDYTSGSYTASGGGGSITLTGATAVETFLDNFRGTITSLTINGTDTVPYDGSSYGGGTVNLFTSTAPGVDPTTVTDIRINTQFENRITMDVDEGDFGIYIGDENFDIESLRDVRITAGDDFSIDSNDGFDLRSRSTTGGIDLITDYSNTQQRWQFLYDGNLVLPSNTFAVKYSNGTTVSLAGDYSNANVADYLPTYSGDIGAGNITAGGNITAAYLIGDGSQITGLAANYGNADVANYLPTFTGDIGAANITASGNITAQYFLGNGSQLTGISASTGNITFNNTTISTADDDNITIDAAFDVRLNAGDDFTVLASDGMFLTAGASAEIRTDNNGTGYVWKFTSTGNLVLPTDTFAVNYANGSPVTLGGGSDYGNANVADYLPTYTGDIGANLVSANSIIAQGNAEVGVLDVLGNATVGGNITAANFLGNIAASDVTGLANVATSGSYDDLSDQPTIPTLGNFSLTDNTILTGNGSIPLTLSIFGPDSADPPALISRDWTFANTGAFNSPGAITATGNITGSNLVTAGQVSATGNIAGGNITASGSLSAVSFAYLNIIVPRTGGTVGISAGNIALTGEINHTGSDFNTTDVIASGNVTAAAFVTSGTVSADTVSANSGTVDGNLTVDGNITATADLTLRTPSGSVNIPVLGGNITFDAATGNAGFPGAVYTGELITVGNASVSGDISAANLVVTGNISGDNTLNLVPDSAVGGDAYVIVDSDTNQVYIRAGGDLDNSGAQLYLGGANSHFSVGAGNVPPLYLKANDNQWTFGTDGVMYSPGNLNAVGATLSGDITANVITALGNITGNFILGNGALLDGIGVTYGNGNVANFLPIFTGNVAAGNLSVSSAATVTGNVTGGNLVTAGRVDATGNITGGNLVTGGRVVATGNVTGGNLTSSGLITTTGNVSGNFITAGNLTVTTNSVLNAVIVQGSFNTQSILSFGTISGLGDASITGNIFGATATITGNVTGGNLVTAGDVTAARVKTSTGTVSALPSAATAGTGARAFVTDASSNTFASLAVGGGSNRVPVYSDGTSWYVG